MISRAAGASWQTILADLSLILFMVTAAALANAPPDGPIGPDTATDTPRPPHRLRVADLAARDHAPAPAPSPSTSPAASLRAEPVGVWQDMPGAPPLATWLAEQGRDPRLRATIIVRYANGARASALARATVLSQSAGQRAADARIVIEKGPVASASVLLGYDSDDDATTTGGSATGTKLG